MTENKVSQDSRIVLVLLPGLDGTGRLLEDFVEKCPPQLTPQVIRYPGDRPQDYKELAALISSQLPGEGRFVVLGESFSGPLAILVAAQRPSGLLGVVLVASFVQAPRSSLFRFLPWSIIFSARPPEFLLRCLLIGKDADLKLIQAIRKVHGIVKPEVLSFRLRQVLCVDVSEQLRTCNVPVLYLQGVRDRLIPRNALENIRQTKPDVAVAAIDAPHLVVQRAPEESWKHISSFLERIVAF